MKTIDFIDSPLLRGNIKSIRDDAVGLTALLATLPEEDTINDCIRKTILVKRHTSRFTPIHHLNT